MTRKRTVVLTAFLAASVVGGGFLIAREAASPANDPAGEEQGLLDRLFAPDKVTVTVPIGTALPVRIDHAIASRGVMSGDTFDATLTSDIRVDGRVVAEAGADVVGRIVEVDDAGRVKGRERLVIGLDRIVMADGDREVQSSRLTFVAQGTKKEDAAVIGGAAAAGAVLGAILDGDDGAVKGAAIGGAGGAGVVLSTKGEDIELPAGRRLDFTLLEPLEVEVKADPERSTS